jgi:hypothetical protein
LVQVDTVDFITVHNEFAEWTVLPAHGAQNSPAIAGFEGCTFNDAMLSALLYSTTRLVSQGMVVENPPDLAPFGLAPQRAAVSVHSKTAANTLYIGNNAPDGKNVYVSLQNGSAVHLVAARAVDYFLKNPLDFVDTQITPPPPEHGPLFTQAELGGAARGSEPIIIITQAQTEDARGLQPNPYRILSPVNAPLFMGDANAVIQSIFSLKASGVAAYLGRGSATELLERFGLAEPYSTLEIQGVFTLHTSKPDASGTVYLRREQVNVVYTAPLSSVPWLDVSFFSLMDKLIIMPYIDDLGSVEIVSPALHLVFYLAGGGDTLSVSALEPLKSNTPLPIDTAHFRVFYQTLLLAQYNEFYDGPAVYEAAPLLEIIYHYKDTDKIDRISFYPAGVAGVGVEGATRRVITSLNGSRPFYSYSVYTDTVIADAQHILQGRAVRPYL